MLVVLWNGQVEVYHRKKYIENEAKKPMKTIIFNPLFTAIRFTSQLNIL